MGCVSSKGVDRSKSLKLDMNQSFKRIAKGITVLEEICSPRNIAGDHIFAFVCSSNNVAGNKLQNRGNLSLQSDTDIRPHTEATSPEIINTWEMMEGLEEDEDEKQQQSPPRVVDKRFASLAIRSKSFHLAPECALPAEENFKRCRSFHTVQEFDEMTERNWVPKAVHEAKSQDLLSKSNMEVQQQLLNASENYIIEVDGKKESHFGQENAAIKELNVIEERKIFMQVNKPRHQQNKSMDMLTLNSSTNGLNAIKKTINEETAVKGNAMTERSLRRKVMANGLTKLRIPTEIEFPATRFSLKEWLEVGGQLFSPGAYVTPKFGKFSVRIPVKEKQCNEEDSVFDQAIVTAFEEAMQQLQAEEECILRQIIENLEEEVGGTKEKEVVVADTPTDHI